MEGLAEIELNGLPNLYDSWWDSWEVDNEGMEELNGDFARLVEAINELGWKRIKELQAKRESYMKKIEELGFKEHRGWISGIGNPYKLGYHATPDAKIKAQRKRGGLTSLLRW